MGWQDGTPVEQSAPPAWMSGKPVTARKPTLWETIKQEAKPDIFNTEHAAYNLGGKVTDRLAPHVSPEVAAGAGYLTNVGAQAIPTAVGMFAGGATAPVAQEGARGLMKSAIKPQVAQLKKGAVPQAIETMLEQGYSPTNAGVNAMRSKVASLADDAAAVVAPSNKVLSIEPAVQNAAKVADKSGAATMGAKDSEAVAEVVKELRSHKAVDDAGLISVQAAQKMKQGNYEKLGDAAYGMGLKPAEERDAIKAVTRALKEGIEKAEPGVSSINKKISDLVNALKVSERRALIEGNKDVMPLGASVATAVSNPVAALGLYANSSAAVKAALARMLYSGSKAIPEAIGGAVGGAVGAESGTAPTGAELARKLRAAQ